MIKKIIGIFVCMLMLMTSLSIISVAEPNLELDQIELKIIVFGSFMLFGSRGTSVIIYNTGTATAHDVCYTISITGGFDGSINFTYTDFIGDIKPYPSGGLGLGWGGFIKGFGPVTLTFTLTSSNTDDLTMTAKGFQLRCQTLLYRR